MGLGNIRRILAGGDEHRGNAVRRMGAAVRRAGQVGADTRDLPELVQPLRFDAEQLFRHITLQNVNSATTRLPRVWIMFIIECFLSVSMLPDRM